MKVRRPRLLSPWREHLRDTMWFEPTAGLVGAMVLWAVAADVDERVVVLRQRVMVLLQEDGDYDTIRA